MTAAAPEALLPRPRITALLDRGTAYNLITVTAGLGYGKTRAVSEYASRARAVGIRLSPGGDHPAAFWQELSGAVKELEAGAGDALARLGFPDTPEKRSRTARLLGALAVSGRRPLVIVLDDYSVLTDPMVIGFIAFLAGACLDNTTLLVVSSAPTDLVVSTLRGGGRVLPLTWADMRFTPEETAGLFRLRGRELTPRQTEAIWQAADGWPLALDLLSAGGERPLDFSLIYGLLEREYYDAFSPALRELLARLALLPAFSGETALQIYRTIAGSRLEEDPLSRLRENLFIHYHPETRLYTLQRVYHNYLRLRRPVLDREDRRQAFQAAGEWFAQNGHPHDAVRCFAESRDYDGMVAAMSAVSRVRMPRRMCSYFLRRLTLLPAEYVAVRPEISVLEAGLRLNRLEAAGADALLREVIPRLEGRLLGEALAIRASLRLLRWEAEAAEDFSAAAALLPQGSRYAGARQQLVGFSSVLYPMGEGPMAIRRGEGLMRDMMPALQAVYHGGGRGLDCLYAAEAAYGRYEMDAAEGEAWRAVYLAAEREQHDIALCARFLLLQVQVLRGNYRGAMACIEEIGEEAARINTPEAEAIADGIRAWLWVHFGDLDRAEALIGPDETASPLRTPMDDERRLLLFAMLLVRREDYPRLLALTPRLERMCRRRGLWLDRVRVLLITAFSLLRADRHREAVDALQGAIDLAWPEKTVTPFIECGAYLRALLEAADRQDIRLDPRWRAAVSGRAATYAKHMGGIIKSHQGVGGKGTFPSTELSKRETEVLQSMAQGLTQEEIADSLGITVNTVKTHVRNIYNKLGTFNRADAVHIATRRGLV